MGLGLAGVRVFGELVRLGLAGVRIFGGLVRLGLAGVRLFRGFVFFGGAIPGAFQVLTGPVIGRQCVVVFGGENCQ